MALTDQPYLPLYVDDWANNNKLKLCSPGAHGLLISIMCILHKEPTYGQILLKQKFKQTSNQRKNFALQIAKLSAFDFAEMEPFFYELLDEEILKIEGEFLINERMVRDGKVSLARSKSGKAGGKATQDKIKDSSKFAKAKVQATTVNGIVNVNEYENVNNNKEEDEILEVLEEFLTRIPEAPRVRKLSKSRKSAIKARLKEYSKEEIFEAIQLAAESDFLTGKETDFVITFDWFFGPKNFIKVIEGNYKNKRNGKQQTINRQTAATITSNAQDWND